jgi:uncharacterized protein (TIGR01777 family)
MDIVVTGASGLSGRALTTALTNEGHRVVPLVRRSPRPGEDAIAWNPEAGTIDADSLEGFDAVVHLAGEGIAERRWTPQQKLRILNSRVDSTTLLATTLAGLTDKPSVLLSGSAIGFYGDRGDEELTEQSGPGAIFLSEVCEAWERATAAAEAADIRVTHLRTGIVLDPSGGALAKTLPLFKLGLGGRLGSGRQWWSWISLEDEVGAIRFLLDHDVRGPVNLAAPHPVTNAEFTKVLGNVLGRPTVLPVPAFGPKLLLGAELAEQLLFTSARVLPSPLVDAGFEFTSPDLDGALRKELGK